MPLRRAPMRKLIRMLIHASVAALYGHRQIRIRTNDTDVVVLAVSVSPVLQSDELWISYCPSTQVRNLPAHTIAKSLGQEKACVLPMFHALTAEATRFHFSAAEARRRRGMYGT